MQRFNLFSMFILISNALVKTSSIEVQIGEPYCCGYATSNEVCHDTCTQLHIPQNGKFFQELQILFPSKCPQNDPKLAEFWRCVNRNNETEGGWVGKRCCEKTVTNECRSSCLLANSSADIVGSCIPDDESNLYECILHKESKQKCCGKRYTNASHSCRRHCDKAFEDGPMRKDISRIRNICDEKMATCMEDYASTIISTSTKKLHCCERASNDECRSGCKHILQTELSNKKIVQKMSEVCGEVIPHEPMWRCFFAGEPRVNGREVNTVSCCERALSPTCRELCLNIYRDPSSDSHVYKLFDIQCRYPGSEVELNQCLNEIDEPCEMGCKAKMSFCENFNHRPTELFRSCSAKGDENARDEYDKWSGGVIALPTHWIPIKNIQQCEPEKWKAVVCALHIKPCGYRSGHSFICKSDCIELMEKCADKTRFGPELTIEGMCEMFSPNHMQDNCIRLSTYTKPSQTNIQTIVTQPCNPNPCKSGHVCIINRHQCVNCSKHKCVPGCKMGYGSKISVLHGSLVRLPDSTRGEGCYKTCICLKTGLYKCKTIPCNAVQKSCKLAGQIKSHGASFNVDCNFCNCFSGNVTCTKRQCLNAGSTTEEKNRFTGMPCNCPGAYNPICGADGQTYPNSCVAICISQPGSTFTTGTCFGKDPCKPNPCSHHHYRCVATPRVCVTSPGECKQYECIPKSRTCRKLLEGKSPQSKRYLRSHRVQVLPEIYSSSYFFSPTALALTDNAVCDANQVNYLDVCKLPKKSKLDYKGNCEESCRSRDNNLVCGYDRVTYNNSCVAKGNRVLIDHPGPCRRIQNGQDKVKSDPCYGVICPPLSRKGCSTILPPGSCCPLCGAMINALLNPDHLQSISHSMWKGPVTVRDIMLVIQRQLHVLECDIYGHLTIDGDLAMIVVSSLQHPTVHEMEACNREAERLFQLIVSRSPTLTSYAILWPITAATITCGENSGSSGVHMTSFLTHVTVTQSIVITCLVHVFIRRFFYVT